MSELRRVRLNKNLSIADLACKAKVSPDQIRSIENGRTRNPRSVTLTKLAEILEVLPATLDPMLEQDRSAA